MTRRRTTPLVQTSSGSVNSVSGKRAALSSVKFNNGEFGFEWRSVVLVPSSEANTSREHRPRTFISEEQFQLQLRYFTLWKLQLVKHRLRFGYNTLASTSSTPTHWPYIDELLQDDSSRSRALTITDNVTVFRVSNTQNTQDLKFGFDSMATCHVSGFQSDFLPNSLRDTGSTISGIASTDKGPIKQPQLVS